VLAIRFGCAAVVEKLDLKQFHEPIKRAPQAGRDATDPQLLVALWLYAASVASVRRANWRGAAKTVRRSAGCAAG